MHSKFHKAYESNISITLFETNAQDPDTLCCNGDIKDKRIAC